MGKYNGHKNWTQWNVSLWVNNDEGLYREAVRLCRRMSRKDAAEAMLGWLQDMGLTETPDGAKYSVTAIQAAMVGL
jgi:hypothetical protein